MTASQQALADAKPPSQQELAETKTASQQALQTGDQEAPHEAAGADDVQPTTHDAEADTTLHPAPAEKLSQASSDIMSLPDKPPDHHEADTQAADTQPEDQLDAASLPPPSPEP